MTTDDLPTHNAAARLYAILDKASSQAQSSQGKKVLPIFCRAMNVNHNRESFGNNMIKLIQLTEQIETQIRDYFPDSKRKSEVSET